MKNKVDLIEFFVFVNNLDIEHEILTITLFLDHKIPIKKLSIENSSPDLMLAHVLDETNYSELPTKMESALISIFTETQNCFVVGTPKKEDVELLAVFSFTDGPISTLFKNRDGKLVQLKKILNKILPIRKKSFVLPVFEKIINEDADVDVLTSFLNYCVSIGEYDKVLSILDLKDSIKAFDDGFKIRLANIALMFHKFDDSEFLFDAVLKNDFGNVLALIGKAQCRYQNDDENFIVYLQKAGNFNKKVTVETVTERFNFRKNKKIDLFDVISLKEAMETATIPPEALEVKKNISLPYRTEKIQGSVFFVKEELEAWKNTMDKLNIASARFKAR